MSFRPQDAALFLRDGDKALLVAENRGFNCLLEYPDALESFSGQAHPGAIVAHPTIKYATADPGRTLKIGDAVSVNGAAFTILEPPRRLEDGVFSIAYLAVAS